MPSQTSSCKFRKGRGGVEFCLAFRGRQMAAWRKAELDVPVYIADAVSVVPSPDGVPVEPALPASFCGALAESNEDRVLHLGRAEYLRTPRLPAVFEYSHGRTAFCCRGAEGELVTSCGGSVAEAVGVRQVVLSALPAATRRAVLRDTRRFRALLSRSLFAGEVRTAAADAALARIAASGKLVQARGDAGEYFTWAFAEPGGCFTVAGVAARQLTLTLLFPFLPHGREYAAEWIDDGEDYYVKGDLVVRPQTVSAATKAVVKTGPEGGGFVLRLCLKR